ncbi:putative uncharacterized protein DDB_G0290521 [Melanotaenia boesemani]|uniref:putative uncharacterized protein DDB_G0290521 n=1 Tax=Melanotaenia boesemani TaxID=1250792 RepID=UPI001C03C52E|nr:putative uncharacterized protein DDB_G0290521 [Melanotaenia boesemani]
MTMRVHVIVLGFLISAAISAPVKVDEETETRFHGEDFYIQLSSNVVEVTFRNRSDPRTPLTLMRDGKVVSSRAKLNQHLDYLIIDSVGEGDEGVYALKTPGGLKSISLIVRDCTIEQHIKYGDNFHISLQGVNLPITFEYRPIAVEANQTSRPAFVLLTAAGSSTEPYQGRISVSKHSVILSAVTGVDEGSYTVRDNKGVIQKKECLNVKEHQNFLSIPYGKRLKINLMLNSSSVQLYYTPDSELTSHLLLDKGEFTSAQTELGLEDRLSLEGSLVFLDHVKGSDAGLFRITDTHGFTVSTIHLKVQPYKLESLYVAIIALLGLLAFLLLVCLLSCLIKVKKRAKRAAALEKLAQNAGKEDEGEAFRQVVKNITKLSEESKHSQADNTEKSQSTEVDIKGLEVSSKEVGVGNLETSDSGVGFNTALPLDTDTDAPDQILDSEAVSISVAPEIKPSPPSAAESKPSAPPALDIKPSTVSETKVSPLPETKKTPEQPKEVKLDLPKPADTKLSPVPSPDPKAVLSPADLKPASSPSPETRPGLSPADLKPAPSPSPEPRAGLSPADLKPAPSPSPEPKAGLSPADLKPALSPSPEPKAGLSPAGLKPALSPSPEPKPVVPTTTTPTPESKSLLTPTPEPPKPTTPEPITNGTPEPGPDSKQSPDDADIIGSSAPKAIPPKTPEVELKSSSIVPEASKDDPAAKDSTTT